MEEVILDRLRNFGAIGSTVDQRIYCDEAPGHILSPWIIFSVPKSEARDVLSGTLDSTDTLEVACYSDSKAQVIELRKQVISALHKYRLLPVQAVLWESTEKADVEGGYLEIVTFRVWTARS